jgi:hypothetical protein
MALTVCLFLLGIGTITIFGDILLVQNPDTQRRVASYALVFVAIMAVISFTVLIAGMVRGEPLRLWG